MKKTTIEKLQNKISLLKEEKKAGEEEKLKKEIEEYRALEREIFTDIKKGGDEIEIELLGDYFSQHDFIVPVIDRISASRDAADKYNISLEKMKEIVEDIDKIVEEYAKQNGFNLVVNSNAILYGEETMDITSQILKISNKKYRKK